MRMWSALVIACGIFSISAAQPVEIIRAVPEGEGAELVRQITLTFNQKMVPLGQMARTEQELGLSITPAIKCQWRWLDPSNLTCQLGDNERLLPANEYALKIKPGLKSESGGALNKTYTLKFSSARPQAMYASFQTWTHPGNPQIHVSFNQSVKIVEAVKLMKLDTGHQLVPVKIVEDANRVARNSTGVVVEPVTPLPLDTSVQLKITDGLESTSGPLKGLAKDIVEFRTFPEFRFAGIRCYVKDQAEITFEKTNEGECSPLQGVVLLFTAPVLMEELKTKLKVTPPLSAKGKEEDVWENVYSSGGLSQPHRKDFLYASGLPHFLLAQKNYRLQASTIVDQFNRKLKEPLDFQFKTSARPPQLTLINQESVLEKNEKTEVPVYVTNLQTISISYQRRTSAGLKESNQLTIKVPKFDDNAFAIPLEIRKMTNGQPAVIEGSLTTNAHPHPWHFSSQVTPFQVIVKTGHLASLVWVTDLVSGKAVPKAQIRVAIQPQNSINLQKPFLTITTGDDGMAKLSGYVTWPALPKYHNYAVEVIKDNDIALLPLHYSYAAGNSGGYSYGYDGDGDYGYNSFGTKKWSYVHAWGTTAQGLYKPGEKVQYKIYLRDQSNRHYIPAPKKTYEVTITDPKGDEVFKKQNVVLNEFGAFSGEFKLPPTATVGWYAINLKSDYRADLWSPARFLVADFTPVPYKVEVQLLGKRMRPGDTLKIDTFATLHAGGPFGNAPARLVGQFHTGWFTSENPKVKDFHFNENHNSGDQGEIFNVEKKLDSKGALHHEFGVTTMSHTFGSIVVESAIQDDRGKNSASTASVAYSGLNRRVGLKQTSWDNKAGEKIKLLYAVVDEDGNPAKGTSVNIDFTREDVKVAKVKGAGNAYLNNYTTNWIPEGKCSGTSSDEPSNCDFVPKKAGTYKAIASIKDKDGRLHAVETWLYVSGRGTVTWASGDDQAVEIVPEKKQFSVGETAKFLVKNPLPGAEALISIERLGVIKSWNMTMKDSAVLVEFPIEDDFVPGFNLSVAITSPRVKSSEPLGQIDLGKPAARFGSVKVAVEDPYKQIKVEAKTEKLEYRPRERVKVSLSAKALHPRSPEEKMEIAVVVLDEAVLNLIRRREEYFDVYQGFYSYAGWDVQTYNLINMLVGRQKFEKKGANAGGAGGLSGPITMRDIFKYVAYWNPSLKPAANGEASFEFTLPDNLTGWRVFTMAVTPTDRMGLGQSNFKVNKPTEIRPVLPNQVTEGDQFKAGFSLLNRTDKNRKISYRIEAEGNVMGDKNKIESTVDLAPFERKSVFLEIKTSTVKESRGSKGKIKFKVAAGDSLDRDGLVQEMPVYKKRSFETSAAYGTTTDNKVSENILFPKDIYTDVGSVSVTLAPSVIGNVEGAFRYMQNYPHICWEQKITKATMASHYLKLKNYVPGVQWAGAKDLIQPTLDEAANFQAPNGGMTYFVPSDIFVSPYLSAFTAVAFTWLREAGYKIPQTVEGRLQEYLKTYLRSQVQTTFFDEGMRSTVRAVALYALARTKAIDSSEIKRFAPAMPTMSLFGQAHYLMAGLVTGDTQAEQDKALRAILNKSSQTSGKFAFNETLSDGYNQLLATPVRDNCSVLSAMVRAESVTAHKALVSDIPFRLVRALTQTRGGRDHFENTQENLFCLQAMIDYSKVYEAQKPAFKVDVSLDGKSFGNAEFSNILNPLKILERVIVAGDPGRKAQVVIQREGQGRLYYATRVTYAPREDNAENINSGMDVKREYYVERGGKWETMTNIAKIKRGELVRVDLFFSIPTARHFVAISDPVVGGLEPVNRDLADTSTVDANKGAYDNNRASIYWKFSDWHEFALEWSRFYHQELKHDFVRYYADYLAAGNYRLSYTAQAIATGEFSASPTHGEEMYDPDVFGKSKPARFTILEK